MKLGRRTLIALSGSIWLLVGVGLLTLGLYLLASTLQNPFSLLHDHRFSLCRTLTFIAKTPQDGALLLITFSLLLGYLKGKYVLSKTVKKQVARIHSLPTPLSLKSIYPASYYLLLGSMVTLGLLFRFLPITPDTRGTIDTAIGAALIQGALCYFRSATTYNAPS